MHKDHRKARERIHLLREFSIPLLAGAVFALVWANYAPKQYEHFLHEPLLGSLSFHFLTNDIFMVLFFGIAAVEITGSFLPGGDLNPWKRAINPLMATIGGVAGPAFVYLVLNSFIGSDDLLRGWGIPTATDIAFAWLVARMVFGNNHPAISFLLLLAVADDGIGLAILAVFYPDPSLPVEPLWLVLNLGAMAAAYTLRKFSVRSYWPYLFFGGALSWGGLYKAHLHPALALAFVIPFLPHARREKQYLFEEDITDMSTGAKFEHEWKIIVDFGLFMFGLANAGVEFSKVGTATWLVLSALIVGKTAGIFIFGKLAEIAGFALPDGVRKKELFLVGIIAGFGFTIALFIAGEAFTSIPLQAAAKMGAMLSAGVVIIALISGKILKIRKIQ